MVRRVVPRKTKGVMVVLAIFFGYFAWIYTYRYDAWKFWLNLVMNVFLFWTIIIPLVSWIWAIVDAGTYNDEVLESYYLD
jgi:hypothetical protein